MTFEEYLVKKKIDSVAFKLAEPAQWQEWSVLFESMSEASFTAQKLYLINPTRRKYLLKEDLIEKPKPTPVVAKPVMRPKPKMN
jgi:hypothetical protein